MGLVWGCWMAVTAWSPAAPQVIRGEYLEVRNCSVYAGPCHFSSEVLRLGQNAILVWHVESGSYQGLPLNGGTAVAVIVGEKNLQSLDASPAARRAVLYVDAPTPPTAESLANWIHTNHRSTLGLVERTLFVPIEFRHRGDTYQVRVGQRVIVETSRTYCQHCTQTPYEVWYQPLVTGVDVEAGMAVRNSYRDQWLSAQWSRTDEENSALIGTFSATSE